MWRRLIVALTLVSLVPSSAVAEYRSTYRDPKDVRVSGSGKVVDIRSTTRRVAVFPSGHRYLTISVRSYGGTSDPNFGFGPFWDVHVRLDTRGGAKGDVWMLMHVADSAQNPVASCKVISRKTGHLVERGRLGTSNGDRAWCTVPFKPLQANKRIRWDVVSIWPSDDDRAPNKGNFG